MSVSPGIEYRGAPGQASHSRSGEEGLVAGMAVSLALTCGALGRRQHCNAQPGQGQHNHTKKRGGAAGQA